MNQGCVGSDRKCRKGHQPLLAIEYLVGAWVVPAVTSMEGLRTSYYRIHGNYANNPTAIA